MKKSKIQKKETRTQKDYAETKKNTVAILKGSFVECGKRFSQGVDNVVEIFTEPHKGERKAKHKRAAQEAVVTFKDIFSGFKGNLKHLRLKNMVRDTSYSVGKVLRISKDTCVGIFRDIVE